MYWGGVPPYFSRRESVDLLGRSDRHIARLQVDRFIPGHSKWDWDYVIHQQRPDILRGTSRGLGRHPDFHANYLFAHNTPAWRLFVRRESAAKLLDPKVVLVDRAEASTSSQP